MLNIYLPYCSPVNQDSGVNDIDNWLAAGSNYSALFGYFFLEGLAYAAIPGAVTVLVLL